MYEYELFKMKPQESITEMTNRLNALVTTLKKLGKYFTMEEVNNKTLKTNLRRIGNLKLLQLRKLKILLLF